MDEEYLLSLLSRYEAGDCTDEERTLVEEWYSSLGDAAPVTPLQEPGNEATREKIWSGIEPHLQPLPADAAPRLGHGDIADGRRRMVYGLAAASVAALIAISVFWLLPPFGRTKSPGALAITTGKGQIKKVALDDGSVVWVNGSSKVRFVTDSAHIRLLLLDEGEAFCEVAHNGQRPFVLRTASGTTVQVLGTSFSVKAYSKLSEEKIVVLSGRVRVERPGQVVGELGRGQAAIVERGAGKTRTTQADSVEADGWTRGKVRLDNVVFPELSIALENTFDMSVRCLDTSIDDKRCTIAFSRSDDPGQLLEVLTKIYKINFTLDRSTRTITIGKTP